jgi:hypothetical protein
MYLNMHRRVVKGRPGCVTPIAVMGYVTDIKNITEPITTMRNCNQGVQEATGAHCTEIDFALSFGAVIVKMIDLSKTGTRDFFDIILHQKNPQELHLLTKS